MKSYPKIEYYSQDLIGENIIAFNKLDGQNLRFEYNHKSGFYKFGTRNVMVSKNDTTFGPAIDIFLNKYSDDLSKVFKKVYPKTQSVVVFGEYYGPNSFAGRHVESDAKTVTLIDVNLYKRGFIPSSEFIQNFSHLDIPEVIYEGKLTEDFINSIRNNDYELSEGVICKGVRKVRGSEIPYMLKIKSLDWLSKVKLLYGDAALREELNGDKKLIELYENI
jgi:hypothetical protein